MSFSQLKLYNNALIRHLGAQPIATLTSDVNSRYVLDGIWDNGDFLRDALKQDAWNFATRSLEMAADTDLSSSFGFPFVFRKPDDWIRTAMVCRDPYFKVPLLNYSDEGGLWNADQNPIYVKYVSDDTKYGMNTSAYPESYIRFLEAYMAWQASFTMSQDKGLTDKLEQTMQKMMVSARGKEALDRPTKMLPQGSWVTARFGGWNKSGSGTNNGGNW